MKSKLLVINKLSLALFGVLILTVLAGFFSVKTIEKSSLEIDQFRSDKLSVIAKLSDIVAYERDIVNLANKARDGVLLPDSAEQKIKSRQSEIIKSWNDYVAMHDRFAAPVAYDSNRISELFKRANTNQSALLDLLSGRADATSVGNYIKSDIYDSLEPLVASIEEIKQSEIQGAEQSVQALEDKLQQQISRVITIDVVAILLTLLSVGLLVNYLKKSLGADVGELTHIANNIAQGNLIDDIEAEADGQSLVSALKKIQSDAVELQQLRNQYHTIGLSRAVLVLNMDGTVRNANQVFLDTLGYAEHELEGRHHRMLVTADYAESAGYKTFWDRLKSGESISGQYKLVDKNGQAMWFQAAYYPLADGTGKLVKIISFATNINEHMQMNADNLRLKAALDSVTVNVMMADQNNRIVYLNPSVLRMFRAAANDIRLELPSFDPEKLLGASIDFFHKNPGHQHRVIAAMKGTVNSTFTIGGRSFRFAANPVFDADGNRSGTVVEWTDITQEVAVEDEVKHIVSSAKAGDLTVRVKKEGKQGFFENLAEGINSLLDSMMSIVQQVKMSAEEVNNAAEEISRGNDDLSQRTEEQAASLQETASSMEEITTTVKQTADNASQANQLAMAARQQAEKGGSVVGHAVTSMSGINTASKKIADIIGVIDEIAFQTNLLALNAAVEAARAGEQGRGFAVVATEVRNLAGRSATAAKEIKALINDSVDKVEEGTKLVYESGRTLDEIVNSVKRVTDIVAEIAAASREQSAGIEQVNRAVMQIDETTQQNSALVEEASAASRDIANQAQSLNQMMAKFKVAQIEGRAPSESGKSRASANLSKRMAGRRDVRSASSMDKTGSAGEESSNDWSEF